MTVMMQENKWPVQTQHLQPMSLPLQPIQHTMTPMHSQNENFVDSYQYSDQTQHIPSNNMSSQQSDQSAPPMFLAPLPQKPDMDPVRSAYQSASYMSNMPMNPSAPRPMDMAKPRLTVPPHFDRKYSLDSSLATMSYGAPSFHPTLRKRRSDSLGFPNEAGPYFTQTKQHCSLYSTDKTNSYSIRVDSKFDRGFFLADNDWTCYRRNYFQVSTAFSLIGSNHPPSDPECPCIVDVDGVQHTVIQFSLGVVARVSNSDKKIDLIQHTPKRDKGPQTTPAARPIRAGGNVNLSSVGSNQTIVTFERIQFKTATANNGKRRAAQQYYVLVVELLAECDNGEQYRVASTQSAPLVVRGRSPGHYADSHERFNPLVTGPSSDNRYFTPHRMSNDMGSPYSNFAPYAPFPTHSPSQMMMTPPTPNTGNTFQNPSPYMMSGMSESSNATPEMFSNGMNSAMNSGMNSPNANDVGSQGQLPQGALPRMSQLPVGLNIHNAQPEGDDVWSRSRNNSAASVGTYHSGNAYNTEDSNGYHNPGSMANSAFNNYDNSENKSQINSMNSDRFNGHDNLGNQGMGAPYQTQDYSNNLQWQGHHSNGYSHETERQMPTHPMQPHHYSYNAPHQAK